jgi:hypothetical protein
MDVFHVKVVSRHGIGHGVRSELLWLLERVTRLSAFLHIAKDLRSHEFWIQLYWIITKLGFCHGFEALTTLREIRVTLHPSEGQSSWHRYTHLKQSMWIQLRLLYSPSLSGLNPVSAYMLIP